jgi:hypothetical protein
MNESSLFDRLMAISKEAAAVQQFEIAYHALAGALHAAQANGVLSQVAEVIALISEQAAAVEGFASPLATEATSRYTSPWR